MKLENQVCTLSQADRLKDLGVVQESLFYHTHSKKWGVLPKSSIDFSGNPSSAFTAAELGTMLQAYFDIGSSFYNAFEKKWGHTWRIDGHVQGIVWHETEAQSRAHLLIHFLEKGIIKVEEINSRLLNS